MKKPYTITLDIDTAESVKLKIALENRDLPIPEKKSFSGLINGLLKKFLEKTKNE